METTMKNLLDNRPYLTELIEYYGDLTTSLAIQSLHRLANENPDTDYFIVSKGKDLLTIPQDDLIEYLTDGWELELDSSILTTPQ